MHGLTVRWSLEGADPDVLPRLRDYVRDRSYPRFTDMEGLRFKTWRARAGEWFEGCYVFVSAVARDEFQTTFSEGAAASPGSEIVGSSPILIEPCDVVAVAEGADGFLAAPTYDTDA
ncbi:MAG: hypothetical protein M3510_12085 [Actinomycetota bacterium]|jgi:hypothetical protein|nr:hypothetical protein [Actinomycetota bacterium]